MKLKFIFSFFFTFIFYYEGFSQKLLSFHSFGGTAADYVSDMVLDGQGNKYITGDIYRTADFKGITLTPSKGSDAFIAKFDVAGNCSWAKCIPDLGGDGDQAISLAIDKEGDIYIGGGFGQSSSTIRQLFIARCDPEGNFSWVKNYPIGITEYGPTLSSDTLGNIFLTSFFSGAATLGNYQLNAAVKDAFIGKIDQAGNFKWVTQFNLGPSIYAIQKSTIVTDPNGNSFVTGRYKDSAYFQGKRITAINGEDGFLVKYDVNGKCIFAKSISETSSSDDYTNALALDSDKKIYVAWQNANFTSFITTFDSLGSLVSQKNIPVQQITDIKIDADKNIIISAIYYFSFMFDNNYYSAGNGVDEMLILKMDSLFRVKYSLNSSGASGNETMVSLELDHKGHIYGAGTFEKSVSMQNKSITSIGSIDLFLIHIFDTLLTNNYNKIQGNVFNDLNRNCSKDSVEKSLAGIAITTQSDFYYGISDDSGNYEVRVPKGSYTVHQFTSTDTIETIIPICPSAPSYFTVLFDTLNEVKNKLNFGNVLTEVTNTTNKINSNTLTIQVYPNPSNGNSALIFLISDNYTSTTLYELIISDMVGRKIYVRKFREKEISVDTKELNTGTYFYRIENAGEVYGHGKILLAK